MTEVFDFKISGKSALVTGASSGLGRRFAKVLAQAGCRVVACARRADRLEELVQEAASYDGEIHAVAIDVTNVNSVVAAFDQAVNLVGTPEITVNNAGIAIRAKVLEMADEDWLSVLDTNLNGVFWCAREAAKRMEAAGCGGSIINIASLLGSRVLSGTSNYSTSKAAVIQMTKAMALELARHNIRVNAICPGYILTDINQAFFETEVGQNMIQSIPQRRLGQASDLDGLLLLLASPASGFMTGSAINVDGGHALALG